MDALRPGDSDAVRQELHSHAERGNDRRRKCQLLIARILA